MVIPSEHSDISPAQERTALLPRHEGTQRESERRGRLLYLLLLCAFLVSLSFGVTQVPILYIFRLKSCDAYYENHSQSGAPIDRCAVREVEARTAREVAFLAGSTMLFGLANLLVAAWSIKRFGVKAALLFQILSSAVRLAIQNFGVMARSNTSIEIIQASQVITIIGGPSGYVLALNSFVTEVVEHKERTGALGRLQGCMMIGAAVGFLVGGLIGNAFGIVVPFRLTLSLFFLCCIYVAVALPSGISTDITASHRESSTNLLRYFGPLRIFAPQKWTLANGRTSVQFGALFLGIGVFLAILATGYIATLLQMYSTNEFGFDPSANGWLIFVYSALRGLYLSLAFPRIISVGRKWLEPGLSDQLMPGAGSAPEAHLPQNVVAPNGIESTDAIDTANEPSLPPESDTEKETFAFDLMYARCSLLIDGILTGLAVFVSKGWQLYIVAVMLPLAAGTGSASKGTILQMIPSRDRVDALSGITLVENVARLSTTAVFGLVFAALAEQGKSHLVFVCNAGVALLGFCALLLSHFPPVGSARIVEQVP